jgi:hypothetical protein
MARSIEIIVGTSGEVQIDAVGFKGADCEKATRFLEVALGKTGKRVKKPDYYANARIHKVQGVGV